MLLIATAVVSTILVRAPSAAARTTPHGAEALAPRVRLFADWVVRSGDNHGMSFIIVDKVGAEVLVFRPDGGLRGRAPALLGLARGDVSPSDIGHRPLERVRPGERVTPAGRFIASLGPDLAEKDVLWVDYDAAIALHRVFTGNPKEDRLRRLATPTVEDNRISYGCINVPAAFFDAVVEPAFNNVVGNPVEGVVYILPEVRSMQSVFPSYDASPSAGSATARSP